MSFIYLNTLLLFISYFEVFFESLIKTLSLLITIKYLVGLIYSQRNKFSFLKTKCPLLIIFSDIILKFFSCVKSDSIVVTDLFILSIFVLKASVSLTGL